ncbi:MAG: hypothetical protein SFU91_03205 [Chloroherpetonaceae bacterium]|nr:hypothetical protein [Chloroherpetonaceae bacterium]
MLHHLVAEPLKKETTSKSKPPLLLLLHGYGSNEEDLFGMLQSFDERFLVMSLRAPFEIEQGSYFWFPYKILSDGGIQFDEKAALHSGNKVLGMIDFAIEKYGIDPDRVFAMGFSQGASLSLGAMLMSPKHFMGIIAMSGGGLRPSMIPSEKNESYNHLRVMLTHGIFDTLLPIHHGRQSEKELRRLPLDLTYREYSMGHEVSSESLADITQWMSHSLNLAPREGVRVV